MRTNKRMTATRFERRPRNHFEVLLHKWRLGDEVRWGDLFAAWVQAPLAPSTPDVVRRTIRKVEAS